MERMKLLVWGAVIALAVLPGCQTLNPPESHMAAQVVPQGGETLVVDNCILIVDASGSMYPPEKFPLAKELTRSFVQAMPDGGYTAALLAYGGESTDRWIKSTPGPVDRQGLQGTASSLYWLGASTPLALVFEKLKPGLVALQGRTAVVVYSDGKTDGEAVLDICTQIIGAAEGEICIHTVQFGNDKAGGALLENMAKLSGCGTYRLSDCITSAEGMDEFVRQVFLAPGAAAGAAGAAMATEIVYFDTDKAAIRQDAVPVLDQAAGVMKDNAGVSASLEGHTDATGSDTYNADLAVRRAQAVFDALVERGVAGDRMKAAGFGEAQPAAPNDTRPNRQLNRRVEIKLFP